MGWIITKFVFPSIGTYANNLVLDGCPTNIVLLATMTQTKTILNIFGLSVSEMARLLRHRHETTVRYWVRVGTIPRWWHGEILNAAKKRGVSQNKLKNALRWGA